MFTSLDKALVALVMSVIYLANNYLGFHFALDPTALNALIMAVLPFLVYFIPNKKVA